MDRAHWLSVAGPAGGVSEVEECLHAVVALGAAADLGAGADAAAELPPLSGKATAEFAALRQLSETHVPFGVERGTDSHWD